MPCHTKDFKYYGANERIAEKEKASRIRTYVSQQMDVQDTLQSCFSLPPEVAEHLSSFYGYRSYEVASIITKENDKRIHPSLPHLQAEVLHCIRQEYAVRLSDMVMRRLRIGIMDVAVTMECLPTIVDLMRRELGWDSIRSINVWIAFMVSHYLGGYRDCRAVKQEFHLQVQPGSCYSKPPFLTLLFMFQ